MKIALISDTESVGGAAVDACRLAEGLGCRGHEVVRYVAEADGQPHSWRTWVVHALRPTFTQRQIARLHPHATRLEEKWARKSFLLRLQDRLNHDRPDVIGIHNIHGAARYGWCMDIAPVCSAAAPTVWTLHDCWTFTGRCAYPLECLKYLTDCDETCPSADEYPAVEPRSIRRSWQGKKRVVEGDSPLVAVTPSHWLAELAVTGFWRGHRVEVIPYGLNLEVYKPIRKSIGREALRIPDDKPVLLFMAHEVNDRRKGGWLLEHVLRGCGARPLTLVTVGRGSLDWSVPGICLHSLGTLRDERSMVLALSAADILVHCALADNLPNVIMEAFACGTPALGFRVGGVPEMIREGETGWLAPAGSPEALSRALADALKDLQRDSARFSVACRRTAEKEYSLDRQAAAYEALFESLLK